MKAAPREPAVLLLSPGIIKWTDADFGLPHLVSLGGYLRAHLKVRVEILDLGYEPGDRHALQRTLEELGPYRLIGVSCYSSFDYLRVMALGRWLKRLYPDVPLVVGGYHPTALPGDFLPSPFDAVIAGEGERGLREFLEQAKAPTTPTPGVVESLDDLPPYQWDLLDRYWPQARRIGSKLQIYLGRGCPYHCTFCMERAKGAYRWRAFSPARALEELQGLAKRVRLADWVVNVADPLFGFDRAWRREVLEGIVRGGLLPLQYWTLTRVDDLDEEDVALLARARFSIGVGLESGSPDMLRRMNKAANPGQYLERIERFAGLALKHGLNWSANVIVGHPGETPETLSESAAFCRRLFTAQPRTTGWLSVDPFRLYPGSQVWEQLAGSSDSEPGTGRPRPRFHHPTWWRSWTEQSFRAEHVDPSPSLDYSQRVRAMYAAFGPLAREIPGRFRGQGSRVDEVFRRSQQEQAEMLSDEIRGRLLERAGRELPAESRIALKVPVGLHVRDEGVRNREQLVTQLIDAGALKSEPVIEALLEVDSRGLPVPLFGYALALQALDPKPGQCAIVLWGSERYMSKLLEILVGPEGSVRTKEGREPADLLWLGAAMPRFPSDLGKLINEGGRCIAFLGPRFRKQDLVCLTKVDGQLRERVLGRVMAPVLTGPRGWST
ncbi:MAG TPA: radical SAM protein [Myxococcales bacterium]|jgi:radical SAM superfamily enzyme YgiQ (UPF0313 family)